MTASQHAVRFALQGCLDMREDQSTSRATPKVAAARLDSRWSRQKSNSD
jgi:hypothetical protein